jgi:DNA-binding NtrC family response regulator
MPGRVVVVHEEPEFNDQTSAALRRAGYEVVAFLDPVAAMSALEPLQHTALLATRMRFAPGKPDGVALARMARKKSPGIKVLFTAMPDSAEHVVDLGDFVPLPISVSGIVRAVGRLMKSPDPVAV